MTGATVTQPLPPDRHSRTTASVECLCGRVLVVRLDLEPVLRAIAGLRSDLNILSIASRLDQIGQAITRETRIMSDFHGDLDAALTGLTAQIEAVDVDLSRELADFAAQVAPKLTPDEQSQLASLAQKLTDFQGRIDTADPAQPPAPAV